MKQAVLGLGTNCGDRLARLREAILQLRKLGRRGMLTVQAVSPIYESEAMLPAGAPASWNQPFLNLCVLSVTGLEPEHLLEEVKRIEREMGRTPRERWAPRVMDIDILAMDGLVHESAALRIPHPGLSERPFALLPFRDLLPEWRFPVAGKVAGATAASLASRWETGMSGVPFQTGRSADYLPQLMGILNVTPDSFSDGGLWLEPEQARKKSLALKTAGASVLDIGAESTRPGAREVDPETEWRRLAPVLEAVAGSGLTVSVDTRHSEVARRSLARGARWINDVSGASDVAMRRVLADSHADLVVMHSLSVPPRKDETLPTDRDPVGEILKWAELRFEELANAGIARERILFDPGVGFGKTPRQNLRVLRETSRFRELGTRILVGHSRKSFLTQWFETPSEDRDIETATISRHLASQGVDYLRVHDVAMNHRVLRAAALLDRSSGS